MNLTNVFLRDSYFTDSSLLLHWWPVDFTAPHWWVVRHFERKLPNEMDFLTTSLVKNADLPTQPGERVYPAPPCTVPIEDLGGYLRARRLTIIRHYYTHRHELVVEVTDGAPIISAEIPTRKEPDL